MEASVAAAAPAQGAEGQAQGQQQAGEGAPGADAQGQFDPAAINDALAQLGQGQEQLYAFLQAQPWAQGDGAAAGDGAAQQQQQQQSADGIDLSFLEDPQVPPEQVGALLDQAIGKAVEQRLATHVQPVAGQVQEMRQTHEAETLAREFPELRDQKVAQEVIGRAQAAAQQLGQPELAGDFGFIRLVYMAGRAADLQNEGVGAQGAGNDAAHLESAAGARPGGGAQGGLTAQEIVGANPRGKVLPFG